MNSIQASQIMGGNGAKARKASDLYPTPPEVTAMRLIDVDELGVGRCSKDVLPAAYCAGWNGLLGLIEKAPTVDAVVVTRCKDCAHWDDDPDTYGTDDGPKGKCMKSFETMCAGDFCSYGEPKEGNHADDHD